MNERGMEPDEVTMGIVVQMYKKAGEFQKAEEFFKKWSLGESLKHGGISKASSRLENDTRANLFLSSYTYNTLIDTYGKAGQLKEASETFAEMLRKGIVPTTVTFNTMIHICGNHGQLEEVALLMQKMEELRCPPDTRTYNILISLHTKHNDINMAAGFFKRMKEDQLQPDLMLPRTEQLTVLEFNVMIKAYGLGKNYDKACVLFDSMESYGVVPIFSYSSLIQILASADLPDKAKYYEEDAEGQDCVKKAITYVDAMKRAGLPGNTVVYNSLIKLYTKVGYLREAQETYKLLQSSDVGPDAYSSNCMIDLYSEHSMVKQAEEIFVSMKRNGDANEFTFAMMLCMYKRLGRFEEAIQIAKQMRELGLLTDLLSFNNVLGLYVLDGRLKEAVGTFKEMVEAAIQPDDWTFKSLGIVLVKCGISKRAIGKLEATREKDPKSGLQAWLMALSTIVEIGGDDDDTCDL
ncbi:hypothetical protein GH714_020647 [Hevea brasiliensis]|uniref:PROP1-like PPR domain-containing protein n=1 Tax=Hevea brasiliensis TaxID=3981 RepID=A0A6A6MNW7_HEVBR|nr:hypothetical protein GH714_020647 [Hevea brasiliensis]